MVPVAVDVFFRLRELSVLGSLEAEKQYVCHDIGFVDGARNVSLDGYEFFEFLAVIE